MIIRFACYQGRKLLCSGFPGFSLFLLFFIGFGAALSAQNNSAVLSGVVLDSTTRQPINAASVVIKGTKQGTSTDRAGGFSLDISGNQAILEFSSIGYRTQSLTVMKGQPVTVLMSTFVDTAGAVIVTAFGRKERREAIVGSVTSIEPGELKIPASNLTNALAGRISGVISFQRGGQPGLDNSSFFIRGVTTLGYSNSPLILVDNVELTSSDLARLQVDDIASFAILKDASAAALYGARGANGVVLITTKKGRAGQRATIDVNSNATWERPNVLPQRQNSYGPGYNESIDSWDLVTVNGQQVRRLPDWIPDMWGAKFDGQPISLLMWPSLGVIPYTGQGSDEVRKFYQTGSTFTNTVGISGGSDKVNYRVSASDLRNSSIFPTSTLNRQTVNARLGFQANNKLYVETRINYIRQGGKNRPGYGTDINTIAMSLNRFPAFLTMDMLKDYKTPSGQANNWTDGRPFNPYWVLNEFLSSDSRDRVNGYLLARYKIAPWLTFQARAGTDFYFDVRDSRIGVNTPTGSFNLRRGQVDNARIRVKEENADILLTATKNLSSNLSSTFSVGANYLNRNQQQMTLQGNNLNVDGLYNIINAGVVVANDRLTRKRMNSVYFTGQLGWKNYFFLDFSGRNDWSSTLGINNYSFFYPSVSGSFVFTDAFKLENTPLSFGKVRLSYAQAGKDASPYQTEIGYNLSTTSYNGQRFASILGTIPLVDLKNELTTSVEAGAELRFLKNRLGIDFTYYSSGTKNQILRVDIPAGTGFSSKLINAGEITNKGIELMVNATPVQSKNFTWDATINFSRNRSKVVELSPGINSLSLYSTSEMSIEARPGQPYGNIVGYAYKRTPDGDKWLTSDGRYQRETTTSVLGNIQPKFLGGINNAFNYKNFSLSFLIDARVGGKIFSYSKLQQWSNGTGKGTENGENLISDGMIQGTDGKFSPSTLVLGRQAYYTAMSYGNIGEEFVLDASYVALREIVLGYNIGKHLKNLKFLKSAKLSAVCRNVAYLYQNKEIKQMGANPEGGFGPFTVAQGFESTGVPNTRSVGVNLSFSF